MHCITHCVSSKTCDARSQYTEHMPEKTTSMQETALLRDIDTSEARDQQTCLNTVST